MTEDRWSFAKLHGAGNDYVLIDARAHPQVLTEAPVVAAAVSRRHFGVGADGLIAISPSQSAMLRMHMWNADGSRGAMCGNGLRCAARFAFDRGWVDGLTFSIETDAGVQTVELIASADGIPRAARTSIGTATIETEPEHCLAEGDRWPFHVAHIGNPHAIVFVDKALVEVNVDRLGPAVQAHHRFSDGANVEFVRVLSEHRLAQRTFERGGGETLACGSGAAVAACAAMDFGLVRGPRIEVELRGGELIVQRTPDGLLVEGPVEHAFDGTLGTRDYITEVRHGDCS